MTEEERAAEVLATMRRRDELRRDVQLLERKLKDAGKHIERLGKALKESPVQVRKSARENAFELPGNVVITVDFDDLKRAVVDLHASKDDLRSVNAALDPGMIRP